MKYSTLIFILTLTLTGCATTNDFSIIEYIEKTCGGNSEHTFYVDVDFDNIQLQIIANAVDDINDDLNTNIQICGIVDDSDHNFIKYGIDDFNEWRVGNYYGTIITLFPENNIKNNEHLRKVILHEFGHYFGTGHSDNENDIMCQGWHGVSDYSKDDVFAIWEGLK